jgi:hypothetical protein
MPTPTLETPTHLIDTEAFVVATDEDEKFTEEEERCMRTVDDLLEQLERKYTSIG